MLFFIKGEVQQPAMLAPEQMRELQLKTLDYFLANKKSGKIVSGGMLAGKKGALLIVDVESIEEFDKFCFAIPIFSFLKVEVGPLNSIEDRQKIVEEQKRASTK
jgi:muconolactone delta-isomerase